MGKTGVRLAPEPQERDSELINAKASCKHREVCSWFESSTFHW
jgi:hypothetical protein